MQWTECDDSRKGNNLVEESYCDEWFYVMQCRDLERKGIRGARPRYRLLPSYNNHASPYRIAKAKMLPATCGSAHVNSCSALVAARVLT